MKDLDFALKSKGDVSIVGDGVTSPIRTGPIQRGVNKLPPFKWAQTEKESRLRCSKAAPQVPQCYSCGKDAALWCDQCQVVSCYVCWGREDHHNADEAIVAFAADQGRLEKYKMLRGTSVVRGQCKAIENATVTLTTPGPEYSVLTGHNTAKRKQRVRGEEASQFLYSPQISDINFGSKNETKRDGGYQSAKPKATSSAPKPLGDSEIERTPVVLELEGMSIQASCVSSKHSRNDDETHTSTTKDQAPNLGSSSLTLLAHVPQTSTGDENEFAALNETVETVTDLDVNVESPTVKEITKSFSEEAAYVNSQDIDIGPSFDLSQGVSEFSNFEEGKYLYGQRPVTAMTDDIDKLPNIGNFSSTVAEISTDQPILSRTNAETFYFRQSMSPSVLTTKGSIQRKLHDTYVEYDDINAIHYSPAKKDPERVAFLANIHKNKVDVTAERTKGYSEADMKRKRRAERISSRARTRVMAVLENKQILARNMTKYKLDKGACSATIKIGKMERRPPLQEPPDPNPLLTAIETFSSSPLNKQLVVPELNADGTPKRKPPDPKEMFLKYKTKKAQREERQRQREQRLLQVEQLELQRARDYFREHGELPPQRASLHPAEEGKCGAEVWEYGDDDMKDVEGLSFRHRAGKLT